MFYVRVVSIIFCLLATVNAYAQKDPALTFQTEFEQYTVRHVIFNSTFILPEVARAYGIKRSKNESILNLSVSHKGKLGGLPAKVSGFEKNLLQQQKPLVFKEIKEKDATYYLAPLRIANEDVRHFSIEITPVESGETLSVNFSQTVYADE